MSELNNKARQHHQLPPNLMIHSCDLASVTYCITNGTSLCQTAQVVKIQTSCPLEIMTVDDFRVGSNGFPLRTRSPAGFLIRDSLTPGELN